MSTRIAVVWQFNLAGRSLFNALASTAFLLLLPHLKQRISHSISALQYAHPRPVSILRCRKTTPPLRKRIVRLVYQSVKNYNSPPHSAHKSLLVEHPRFTPTSLYSADRNRYPPAATGRLPARTYSADTRLTCTTYIWETTYPLLFTNTHTNPLPDTAYCLQKN